MRGEELLMGSSAAHVITCKAADTEQRLFTYPSVVLEGCTVDWEAECAQISSDTEVNKIGGHKQQL